MFSNLTQINSIQAGELWKMKSKKKCPSCGYKGAIKYNRFNEVVQCHFCGQVITIKIRCPTCGNELDDRDSEITSGMDILGLSSLPIEELNDLKYKLDNKHEIQEIKFLQCEYCLKNDSVNGYYFLYFHRISSFYMYKKGKWHNIDFNPSRRFVV